MYIDNIIRLLEQKPYLKTHLINFNKRFEDKAKNSCFNHDTAIKQYNNFYKLMQEKCYVLTCFAILEEALKDLKINDFMLLYDVYFYKKHFKTIIESLGINQRTYFRRLQIAKANLLKTVKYHDKKGYI